MPRFTCFVLSTLQFRFRPVLLLLALDVLRDLVHGLRGCQIRLQGDWPCQRIKDVRGYGSSHFGLLRQSLKMLGVRR